MQILLLFRSAGVRGNGAHRVADCIGRQRVNDQFRVCFRWTGSDAEDVEIVDYH